LLNEVLFEGAKEDLPLTGLEAVNCRWDGASQIRDRKLDKLLIDEVRVIDDLRGLIKKSS
jgi:hypothetical protein